MLRKIYQELQGIGRWPRRLIFSGTLLALILLTSGALLYLANQYSADWQPARRTLSFLLAQTSVAVLFECVVGGFLLDCAAKRR